jgi:hypothetical protein
MSSTVRCQHPESLGPGSNPSAWPRSNTSGLADRIKIDIDGSLGVRRSPLAGARYSRGEQSHSPEPLPLPPEFGAAPAPCLMHLLHWQEKGSNIRLGASCRIAGHPSSVRRVQDLH